MVVVGEGGGLDMRRLNNRISKRTNLDCILYIEGELVTHSGVDNR